MNELTNYTTSQLPDTLEDLTQFVLVGKARLQAYMLNLRNVNKLSTAQGIRDQVLQEAQEINEAVKAAEIRIGEILLAIPKQSGGDRKSEDFKNRDASNFEKTKSETAAEMGYTKDDVSYYQQMAKNPEVVKAVLEEARIRGEIATKADIKAAIKEAKDEQAEVIKDLQEERDYLQFQIQEMEEAEPKTIIPDDYEELKKKAKKASAFESDYKKEQSKVLEKQNEILRLQDEIEELKRGSGEGVDSANISENVFYFCAICNNFISNVGGLVWLTERIVDMPEREKDLFLKAARSFNDWSQVFKDNLERSLENGQTRTDTGVPLLTD